MLKHLNFNLIKIQFNFYVIYTNYNNLSRRSELGSIDIGEFQLILPVILIKINCEQFPPPC